LIDDQQGIVHVGVVSGIKIKIFGQSPPMVVNPGGGFYETGILLPAGKIAAYYL